MPRTVTITIERIRRVVVRTLRTPGVPEPPLDPADRSPDPQSKGEDMKKLIAPMLFAALVAVPALAQSPPFVGGLQGPSKIAFTRHGNLVVAESGTMTNNTGRISLIDRANARRRTLVEGLPSGLSRAEGQASPSGPSGVAVQDRTVYVTIGAGDVVTPGPAPGTEQRNPSPASPILASLLSLRASASLDTTAGGFALQPSDHARLKNGETLTLTNSAGEQLAVRLIADFPDFTEEPRLDFPANVRAGNPFGVAVQGQTLYVVDASQNLIRRVDANTGQTTTLTTFGKVQNPLPMGAPVIDAVPDSVHLRGNDLVVTTLTGFPFPSGKAEVRKVALTDGSSQALVGGLTAAIDVAPLGHGPNDPLVVLEFSTNMLQQAPGRVQLVTPGGNATVIAQGLPTPTSMAVDQTTGEIFVTHIFPGFITRIAAAAALPAAPPSAVVPAVASTAGAFNSQYTTAMQISNPYSFAISGRVVVHPAGVAGSPADASTAYTLAPFETRLLEGVIANGVGSADVLAAVGTPVVVTTITDTRTGATLQMPLVDPADALTPGVRGAIVTPPDPSRQRFNIGIRTLNAPAAIVFRVHDSAGRETATVTRVFPPTFFQQFAFAELLGAAAGANQAVTIEVTSGSAIVYGAATDNATGAMSLQIAQGVEE